MTVTTNQQPGVPAAAPEDSVHVTVDGVEVSVPKGTLVIRAAEAVGIEIPRFCDHPLLEPVGACRQCLVEVEGQRKPLASCTTTVTDGMVVRTQVSSPVADKAQRGNMEFLLINHPLDCPVCDKGGECPLQNQAMSHGRADSRFEGVKRTFPKPINISAQVLLDRERCVLCARCTRFQNQIAGDVFIDLMERGALQQVGIYENDPLESYFSGNTIQICPVGALTSAAYRFRARPFDLVSTPTVCEHCAAGCGLRADHRRGKVLRRLAAAEPEVNEEWNCDKGRFAFPYVASPERLVSPLVRDESGELVPTSWADALDVAARGLTAARGSAGVLVGGRVTREDAYAYAKLARVVLGTNDVDLRARSHSAEEADFLAAHVAGTGLGVTYRDLEHAPAVVLVGLEPEDESPIVFLRLRKAVRRGGVRVFSVGAVADRGLVKLSGRLLPTVPGDEPAVLAALGADAGSLGADAAEAAALLREPGAVLLAGERLAGVPGALTALSALAATTGARLAWVPRRAGERGAIDAGALPGLLPGGRSVADPAARAEVAAAWGVQRPPRRAGPRHRRDPRGRRRRQPRRARGRRRGTGRPARPHPRGARARVRGVRREPGAAPHRRHRAGRRRPAPRRGRGEVGHVRRLGGPRPTVRPRARLGEPRRRARAVRARRRRRPSDRAGRPAGRRPRARGARPGVARAAHRLLVRGRRARRFGSLARRGRGHPQHLAAAARPRRPAGRRALPRRHRPALGRPAVGRHGGPSRRHRRRGGARVHRPRRDHPAARGVRRRRRRRVGAGALGGQLGRLRPRARPRRARRRPPRPGRHAVTTTQALAETPVWLAIIKALAIFVFLVLMTLFTIWLERRVVARMQMRIGPNRVGPQGLLQSLADGVKLALKEDIIPKAADVPIFILAPLLSTVPAFIALAVIPFGPNVSIFGHVTALQLTDFPVAVLYVIAVASVGVYGIVLAGWSSGSTYPLLGGLRSTAQVISYEVAMGLSFVAVFLYAGSMSTSDIVAAQGHIWYIVLLFPSFCIYAISMVGETNRAPFDLAEAEGELVGGFHTEYSSLKFALFFLAEYINMVTVSALATTLFLGGWRAPLPITAFWSGANSGWWPVIWFVGKLFAFIFVFIWLRGTLPRMRYDQFMRLGWKILIPVSLAWIVVVGGVRAYSIENTGTDRRGILIGAGVVLLILLVALYALDGVISGSDDEEPGAPPPFDPMAGGFPVPPLPGQTPADGRAAIAATVTVGAGGPEPAPDGDADHEEAPGV